MKRYGKNHEERKEEACGKVKKTDPLARKILAVMPVAWRKRWDRSLEKRFKDYSVSQKENERLQLEFQLKQVRIVFWGLILTVILCVFAVLNIFFQKDLAYMRNPFGKGHKEIRLQMEYKGQEEFFDLELQEQTLDKKEENRIYREFMKDLKKVILGENASFSKVNRRLNLVDSLEGYPFTISYEPEDPALIDWNGDPGQKALSIKKGESISTYLMVEASYKEYELQERIEVCMIAPDTEKITVFKKWKNEILSQESASRKDGSFVISYQKDGMKLKDPSQNRYILLPVFCMLISMLLFVKGYMDIQERKKVRHKENLEDFPLIVHLLTLYMGAGLSFSSAVSRISRDYDQKQRERKKRFAFEQMMVMDHCMHMGIRPKEACLNWGQHFEEKIYAKFAMLLSQSFSKGSREIRTMMEKEQQDAFQVQIDCVRKEGEEASTKLLFPMIVLLFIIMILIMFPAIMQFYGI